ncbi:stAR-related lipid transfer protein 13 isoform X1 [Echinops telfairi]|uniref:StAR-related lipid transfer protein 13 isoform X1 n=1 Tax=Echinops telfairi TaxID=9371 RepID=A0AC55DE10_ECHTE|nr:stAR-related lipid transfer protein 13 isoform X1 [Echinops telfairi]
MRLDVNLQRKKSNDSDEDDLCLSNKWTFQRTSRRWSRVDDPHPLLAGAGAGAGPPGGASMRDAQSTESMLTELSEPEVSSLHSGSSAGSVSSEGRTQPGTPSAGHEPWDCPPQAYATEGLSAPDAAATGSHLAPSPCNTAHSPGPPKNEKSGRTRAKSILKRMEGLRARGGPGKHKGPGGTGGLAISGPLLQQDTLLPPNWDLQDPGPGASTKGPAHSPESQLSGSAPSTPGPPEPRRQEASKRGGLYLEDLDVLAGTVLRVPGTQGHTSTCRSQEDLLVHIPKDHKPGTFPKALSIESLAPTDGSSRAHWRADGLGRPQDTGGGEPRLTASCSRESRISIYDNVPSFHLYASTGDLLDLGQDGFCPHLEDIVQQVSGLQEVVDDWSRDILPELSPGPAEPTFPPPAQITLDFEGNSISESGSTPSDGDPEAPGGRERRDSGVGASLTRPNRRLRWHSLQLPHQPPLSTASSPISSQTAGQLNLLQRLSLLRLTAIMDRQSTSSKHSWTWSVPKFMKRMKVPDYKDKTVFGVPLTVHVQRTGQPLPQSIQQALRYLHHSCLDQVGLFRKSGVKSRIQALRQMNERFPRSVSYEEQSAYDVADMVKQFFRDLPEPLFTSKLSDTFLHIYQYVPKEQWLQAVQAAILLLADENREVLQTLLCFLSDVVSLVQENQMTPMNLAVCLAPSLFHLNLLKKESTSRVIQKKYATGKPDQRDLSENLAAAQGLAHMIVECDQLFEVPLEMVAQSKKAYLDADTPSPTLNDLGKHLEEGGATVHAYLEHLVQGLQKEAKEKFKGWVACPSIDNAELAFKKVEDGHPLKLWKASVEVEAPPSVVLNRVLRERHLWDEDFVQWKVLEALDKHTEVYQYLLNAMDPHPARDFVVLSSPGCSPGSWLQTEAGEDLLAVCPLCWLSPSRSLCPLLSGPSGCLALPVPDLEDGSAQGHVRPGIRVGGAPGSPAHGRRARDCDGISVPDRALRLWEVPADPRLQGGPQGSLPRVVQQGLWSSVHGRSRPDPKLFPAPHC